MRNVIIQAVPRNLGGRPRLSEAERRRRELIRSSDPLKRVTKQQRAILEALVKGKSLEDTAADAGAHLDVVRATAYRPEMRMALAELRAQVHERIRDAAIHRLACIAGCTADADLPASEDDKLRASALRGLMGTLRETPHDKATADRHARALALADDPEKPANEAEAVAASPQLVIMIGDEGQQDEGKASDAARVIDMPTENEVLASRTAVDGGTA